MEVMMHGNNARNFRRTLPSFDYDEDTAHTVEVQREVDENGELGSFGFTLLYERPPIVRTIVPGGPAERAGLKKDEVVIAVNGQDVTQCSHAEVVSIISSTPTPGVWLTVCDSNQTAEPRQLQPPVIDNRLGFSRVHSLGSLGSFSSLSVSTPVIPHIMEPPRKPHYTDDSPPPKYSEFPSFQRNGSANSLSQRAFTSSMQGMSTGISPLKRKVLTQSFQSSGPQSSLSNGHFAGSDQSMFSSIRASSGQSGPSPTPAAGAYNSASVLVLYIGPVEIPESWSARELSSRCLQECTRRLLSQRQEFIEAFLDVNLQCLKILNVSQAALFKHKREELYYCGVCTNDEQYFGIVTQKLRSKSGKKSSPSGGQGPRANLCHVFKVIQHKSVLVLHSGSPGSKGKPSHQVKPKTIPVMSCVTIINALQGLFTGETAGSGKMFGSDPSLKGGNPSVGGSSDSMYASSPDKLGRKKKLEVVDLRSSAFVTPSVNQSSFLTSNTSPSANPNIYVSGNVPAMRKVPSGSAPVSAPRSANKGDYPSSLGTPAYHQRGSQGGGTWYSVDSPKDNHHSRQTSWSYGDKRNSSASPPEGVSKGSSLPSVGRRGTERQQGPRFDSVKRISDDSSMSSLSDCRTPSPTKLSMRSSLASRSRSPSPTRSLSYSSGGSRSNSPSPARTNSKKVKPQRSPAGSVVRSQTTRGSNGGYRFRGGSRAFDLASIRAVSPTHSAMRSSRLTLKRQGSENSVMDAQDSSVMSPYRTGGGGGLPPKNGPLTSSIGSVATLTTVADEQADPEECGRVAGWVANFDKLLQDPLGVKCLLQFLEKEHCEENILFWRDAEEFKKEAKESQNLLALVKKIYDQYLAPSSPHTVNVDDRVLKAVEAKLSNPSVEIFNEAQEQIYQLMKMDCYPRFKKSELAKECLLCEMEGKPLPIESVPQQPQKPQQSQYTGIWKRHRSLFNRWVRPRDILGVLPEGKKGADKGRKEEGSRTRKAVTVRENKNRSSAAKEFRSSMDDASPLAEDFKPEDHLNIFQAHKGNVFEINLPNKVTKIMAVPPRGSVKDAIQPVLKKLGYSFDIMELRFANNFQLIDLRSSASVLVGQHIIVTKSKNTFIAVIPDMLEKILPANGTKTVGELFYEVLEGIGKLQNFAVYMEGSRVPLDFNVDTSVLVGQKVLIKYLPGPCPVKSQKGSPGQKSKGSLHSSSSSSTGVDDLISMLDRVQGDTLHEQKSSPSPRTTPEPGGTTPNSSPSSDRRSPSDGRHRSHSHSNKKRSGGSGGHKSLSGTRSIDPEGQRGHHRGHRERSRSSGKSRGSDGEDRRSRHDAHLKPPASSSKFGRTQSGSSILSSSSRSPESPPKRAHSPPATMSHHQPITDYQLRLRNNMTSPPPPTSKPPALPSEAAKRLSNSRGLASDARWSNASFRSTDSASSEDSDLHARVYHGQYPDHTYMNRAWTMGGGNSQSDQPRYFPRAHSSNLMDQSGNSPPSQDGGGPTYVNTMRSYRRGKPSSSKAGSNSPPMPSPPSSENPHPLDNFVSEASLQAPSGVAGQRKTSHPLQNSLSRGPMTASGTQLSSYPWHNAQRRPSQPHRTAAQRKGLTENPELMEAGDQLVKKEMDEFHHSHSDGSLDSGDKYKTPLSPTTHTLILPDDSDTPSQQLETFV